MMEIFSLSCPYSIISFHFLSCVCRVCIIFLLRFIIIIFFCIKRLQVSTLQTMMYRCQRRDLVQLPVSIACYRVRSYINVCDSLHTCRIHEHTERERERERKRVRAHYASKCRAFNSTISLVRPFVSWAHSHTYAQVDKICIYFYSIDRE